MNIAVFLLLWVSESLYFYPLFFDLWVLSEVSIFTLSWDSFDGGFIRASFVVPWFLDLELGVLLLCCSCCHDLSVRGLEWGSLVFGFLSVVRAILSLLWLSWLVVHWCLFCSLWFLDWQFLLRGFMWSASFVLVPWFLILGVRHRCLLVSESPCFDFHG